MARGDQIYVLRPFAGMDGLYEHHGIECGDGTVIHYRKPDDAEAEISRTSLAIFSRGNRIQIQRYTVSLIATDVIQRAESRLGERQYDLWKNNCEHFATWCKTGISQSLQLERFGLGTQGFTPAQSRQLMEQAQQHDFNQAIALFQQALGNIATAQQQLQPQYDQAIADMNTWHRVAQLALRQGKESLARAALERKIRAKRQAAPIKTQLDQLAELQRDIQRNLVRSRR